MPSSFYHKTQTNSSCVFSLTTHTAAQLGGQAADSEVKGPPPPSGPRPPPPATPERGSAGRWGAPGTQKPASPGALRSSCTVSPETLRPRPIGRHPRPLSPGLKLCRPGKSHGQPQDPEARPQHRPRALGAGAGAPALWGEWGVERAGRGRWALRLLTWAGTAAQQPANEAEKGTAPREWPRNGGPRSKGTQC